MQDLKKKGLDVGQIGVVKINSGLFGVLWENTLESHEETGMAMRFVV